MTLACTSFRGVARSKDATFGIMVDGNGAIFAGSDDQRDIKKYVKN
jgi:hypothetical protein